MTDTNRFWTRTSQLGMSLLQSLVGLLLTICIVGTCAKHGWPDPNQRKPEAPRLPNDTNSVVQEFIDWIPERKPGPGDEMLGTIHDPWKRPAQSRGAERSLESKLAESNPTRQLEPGEFFDSSGRPLPFTLPRPPDN